MFDKPIDEIIWCYAQENSLQSIKEHIDPKHKIKYVKGVPETFENPHNKSILIVIDDLMMENYGERICSLFVHGSHHRGFSLIYIVQNLFASSRYMRTISLNASYLVIFNSPRARSQFKFLARQLLPEHPSSLYNVYKEATEERPFSYFFIDMTQKCPPLLRFRTNIFDKKQSIVFCNPETGRSVQHETIKDESAYALCFEKCKAQIT